MKRILFLLLLLTIVVSGCGGSSGNEGNNDNNTDANTSTEPNVADEPAPLPEGFVEVPDLIGMKRDDAYEVLEDLGLVPLTFWVIHDEYGYGDVTDLEPGVGEIVQVDSEIVLDVVGQVINIDDADQSCGPAPEAICDYAKFVDWCNCVGGTYVCIDPSIHFAKCFAP